MKFTVKDMILIGLFVALMVVGAFLKIPNPLFPLVPITLQLFFCIYAGLLLGIRNAFFSQLLYIVIGLVGVPVFASGGGIGYVFNPTFGYLIGFLLAATVVAVLVNKADEVKLVKVLGASIIGLLLVYLVGNVYLFLIKDLYLAQETSLIGISVAMLPYMVKDLVLVVIAALTSVRIIPALRKAGY